MKKETIHSKMPKKTPVVLCILDGWGIAEKTSVSGISSAKTPHWDRFLQEYSHAQLQASELFVGLPEGQMGNSEVGHMSIGSGRVIMQELPRIDQALANNHVATNPIYQTFMEKTVTANGDCHLLGLLSPGGVHAHQDHLLQLAKLCAQNNTKVWIHAILDGRDTPPQSAAKYIADFLSAIKDFPQIQLATIGGRYFAMDRDHRWERTAGAYQAIVQAKAPIVTDPLQMLSAFYVQNIGDEFIPYHVCANYTGMQTGDSLFVGNFRADRMRQILMALLLPDFDQFDRSNPPHFSATLGLTDYSAQLSPYIPTLFPKQSTTQTLGEVVAAAGLRQLRTAETEKYAHVTFFFNGGREEAFEGESRHLVPSPLVATYDLQPEMSAFILTDFLVSTICEKLYDLIVVNFANPDMVGHTGVQAAIKKAVETVDDCLFDLETACLNHGYCLLITADHGNVEQMVDPETGQPHTAHTCNPVPFVVVQSQQGEGAKQFILRNGSLSDIAPTVLAIMGLKKPAEMTGISLIIPNDNEKR